MGHRISNCEKNDGHTRPQHIGDVKKPQAKSARLKLMAAVRTKVLRANTQSDGRSSENQLGSRLLRNQQHALDAEDVQANKRNTTMAHALDEEWGIILL